MAYRSEMAFLFPAVKKVRKPRKPSVKKISIGARVKVHGRETVVTGRDERFANAWFVEGTHLSFSRDMIVVL